MRSPGFETVTKFATCSKCGDSQLVWVQSRKSGKWYLVQAYVDAGPPRTLIANRFSFHRCPTERK